MIGQSQPEVRNVRQEEVVLARLRIVHTRTTHSYLLKNEKFWVFHVDTNKQLFNDVHIDNVFLFLKKINLLNKL